MIESLIAFFYGTWMVRTMARSLALSRNSESIWAAIGAMYGDLYIFGHAALFGNRYEASGPSG